MSLSKPLRQLLSESGEKSRFFDRITASDFLQRLQKMDTASLGIHSLHCRRAHCLVSGSRFWRLTARSLVVAREGLSDDDDSDTDDEESDGGSGSTFLVLRFCLPAGGVFVPAVFDPPWEDDAGVWGLALWSRAGGDVSRGVSSAG